MYLFMAKKIMICYLLSNQLR